MKNLSEFTTIDKNSQKYFFSNENSSEINVYKINEVSAFFPSNSPPPPPPRLPLIVIYEGSMFSTTNDGISKFHTLQIRN